MALTNLAFDVLRTAILGGAQNWCRAALRDLIGVDVWATGTRSQDTLYMHARMRHAAEWLSWYKVARGKGGLT